MKALACSMLGFALITHHDTAKTGEGMCRTPAIGKGRLITTPRNPKNRRCRAETRTDETMEEQQAGTYDDGRNWRERERCVAPRWQETAVECGIYGPAGGRRKKNG
jgi:hypothetical protein